MKARFFVQTKKPWRPFTLYHEGFTEESREVQDIMCHGHKLVVISIFFLGFYVIWDKWSYLEEF